MVYDLIEDIETKITAFCQQFFAEPAVAAAVQKRIVVFMQISRDEHIPKTAQAGMQNRHQDDVSAAFRPLLRHDRTEQQNGCNHQDIRCISHCSLPAYVLLQQFLKKLLGLSY